jgi:hypothetical protein
MSVGVLAMGPVRPPCTPGLPSSSGDDAYFRGDDESRQPLMKARDLSGLAKRNHL